VQRREEGLLWHSVSGTFGSKGNRGAQDLGLIGIGREPSRASAGYEVIEKSV
jgi:hypothetical protein